MRPPPAGRAQMDCTSGRQLRTTCSSKRGGIWVQFGGGAGGGGPASTGAAAGAAAVVALGADAGCFFAGCWVLEAAGADARAKAETLARSLGKNIGEVISVTEDILVSDGAYGALRSTMPALFGSGAVPSVIGELEYYARVSANFRIQ